MSAPADTNSNTNSTIIIQNPILTNQASIIGSPNNTTGSQSPINSPICKDFLNGICTRQNCKYQHVVTLYKPLEPKHILNQLFIPGKGNVLINLTDFSRQQYYNGLFLCNLGDIIATEFIEKLLAICIPRSSNKLDYAIQQKMRTMITNEIITNHLSQKIQKIINWTSISTKSFNKMNYSTIFIYDISNSVREWIFKSKLIKHPNTNILKNIINCLNMLFTCLFEHIPGHVSDSMNIYISYLQDELSLNNRGPLEFLNGLITSSPGKYISNYFHTNIYYIGKTPDLTSEIKNSVNTGFVYCCLTGAKYINICDIFQADGDVLPNEITLHGDMQIGQYIHNYNIEVCKHNSIIYKNIFEKNAQIKEALKETIPLGNIRNNSLVIIGCNLDVEFDKGLVAGLKETVGAIDFTTVTNKPKLGSSDKYEKKTSKNIANQINHVTGHKNEGCCNDDQPTTTTMSFIMPIFGPSSGSSGSNSNSGQNTSSTQLNELMRDLLGGMFNGKLPGTTGTTAKVVQNRVCTIGINLIKSFDGTISPNQPFDTLTGIEKIKEYGAEPENKIIILCSSRMTHGFFIDFVKQITRTPGYPIRISANFIDFNINPSLRKCLAYHNYRMLIDAYNDLISREVPITQICKVSNKFMNYLNSISESGFGPNTISNTDSKIDNQCCTCCACLSRNGIGYAKFGHLPYVPLDQLKQITDDSWLPRY